MAFWEKAAQYWLMSCRDAMMLNFSPRQLGGAGKGCWKASRGSLFEQCVGEDTAREVFEFSRVDKEISEIPVMLCPTPYRIYRKHIKATSSRLPDVITPLWIPAQLGRDGMLQPVPGQFPWMPRDFLTPNNSPPDALVGDLDLLDRFLTENMPPATWDSWEAQWQYAALMYKTVTGLDFGQAHSRFYYSGFDGVLFPSSAISGATRQITQLYEQMAESETYPPLFRSLCSRDTLPDLLAISPEEQFLADGNHVGQMGSAYPLAESQREALCHLNKLPDGGLLAVNGPPGTGKTTLVQSVVADLVVKAAIKGDEPPLIFATSTNNQAVTNVIDAMGKAYEDSGPLAGRWLPGISSYGLYCPSDSAYPKALQEGVFQVENKQFSGFFAWMETQKYLDEAIPCFLAHCNDFTQDSAPDLTTACNNLHVELLRITTAIASRPGIVLKVREFRALIERLNTELLTLEAEKTSLESALLPLQKERSRLTDFVTRCKARTAGEPWYFRWLFFIPSIASARAAHVREFADSTGLPQIAGCTQAQSVLIELGLLVDAETERIRTLEQKLTEVNNAVVDIQKKLTAGRKAEEKMDRWHHEWGIDPDAGSCADLLDQQLRHRAFKLAVHYWEARWLLETEGDLADKYNDSKAPDKLERRLRHFAMITPCFVSTLFTLPAFVTGYRIPLYGCIDLLVVDESGQVSPEIAGAAFALAKRALVIGDTLQIEPVWSIPAAIDSANCEKYLEIDLEEATCRGISVSAGSVMKLAQGRSCFSTLAEPRGLMLVEHRRCLPEIISYCNELAYQGRLKPMRSDRPKEGFHLPPMGWAHCRGASGRESGSRNNPDEARIIARWVADHHDEFVSWYNAGLKNGKAPYDIGDLVGIVTPFRNQSERIQRELQAHNLEGITVGTVHALQGAERAIIIFSPVYDAGDQGRYFFDTSLSMLNVGVSRAKDSFLIFGDVDIFDPERFQLPSGLLARHILGDPSREITDIVITERPAPEFAQFPAVTRLATLEEHRVFLKHALESAREKVLIVSPWLTAEAITADDIPALVQAAVVRGVAITVFTDLHCNRSGNDFKAGFTDACALLTAAGATITLAHNIHNKTICVDRDCMVEGSFNWLSAVRDRKHRYQRAEMSIAYSGPGAAGFIDAALKNMEARKIYLPET